jgi:hypothetical protein
VAEVEVRFAEASRLALGPGDTILLRVPPDLDYSEIERIGEQMNTRFPGRPILVLAADIDLESVTLHDAVDRFVASRDVLRAALAAADRDGVGRNEIARIAAPAYSRATVLKMLTEDNGPAPAGPVEEQMTEAGAP